jgi:hypothetical protein
MKSRNRTDVPPDWPWHTHPDRWDVKVERRESGSGPVTVITPMRCDPAFGPSVELRLRDPLELFLSSGEDDGRHVVPLSPEDARMVATELANVIKATTSPRTEGPNVWILPLPRAFTDEEARFLVQAFGQLRRLRPKLVEIRSRAVRSRKTGR